ncbi:NUDIX domain-containing protein [Microbacterium sp. STN6]|uniref:NUDIX hydrolase n=1 Tax=Microbacterium sp. STN6 TaxID=2995588 RepID=UPI002260FA35|nr:NUDIX domain-containing protein [Microbacterium sp. STN6]MCX7522992.1 NUDIX domain-containing protein [Microbacterium sp. STN6]
MPTPEYIVSLREKIGHDPLWLTGVTAVVLRGSGASAEVLLVRGRETDAWSPVTGISEPGEEPAVTAEREVLEEAGIVAVAESLVWVHVMEPVVYGNGDRCQFLDLVFRCRYVSGEARVGDDENSDVRWFPLDALPELPSSHPERIRLSIADAAAGAASTRFER